MNLKLRLKNKATLLAIILAMIALVYQVLGLLGIAVPLTEDQVVQIAGIIINLLVGLGILVDPTTAGVSDSIRAMGYDEPVKATHPDDDFPAGGESDVLYDETEHEIGDPEDPEV